MAEPFLLEARDLPQAWKILVPEYRSVRYSPLVVKVNCWESKYAESIAEISRRRSENRINNYFIPEEIERVKDRLRRSDKSSVRFGAKKEGHGYHGERGDFCLVGAAIDGRKITVMYRSLELIGGFAYDLVLINQLGRQLGIEWRSLQILAASAHVFALKGNSNEKLYPKLKRIFDT